MAISAPGDCYIGSVGKYKLHASTPKASYESNVAQ